MYKTVIETVNTSLKSINNIPQIFEENMEGKPELLTPWVRTTLIPSEPLQISRGVDRLLQYSALMQIDVFIPKGKGSTSSIVDDIIGHFNDSDNRELTSADDMQLIVLRSWRGVSSVEQNWYRSTVFVRLQWFNN